MFFQTAFSISFFALLLSSMVIGLSLYQAAKIQEGSKGVTTKLLGWTFGFLSVIFLFLYLEEGFYFSEGLIFLFLESFPFAILLIFALQFSYHYPEPDPKDKDEARLVLVLSIAYTLLELWLLIGRLAAFKRGDYIFRPEYADYPLVIGFGWTFWISIRRTIRESRKKSDIGWLKALLKPQGRDAQTTRAFSLLFFLALSAVFLKTITDTYFLTAALPPSILYNNTFFLITFILISSFFSLYINYFPEIVNVRDRFSMQTVLTNLMILSVAAWILTPPFFSIPIFPDIDLSEKSFHYAPTQNGGYSIRQENYSFVDSPGEAMEDWGLKTTLPFDFPFFGERYNSIYIHRYGLISFEESVNKYNLSYAYGKEPAIFALHYQSLFVCCGDQAFPESGIFYHPSPSEAIITWQNLPDEFHREQQLTFQVVLYPDGRFDINFKEAHIKPEYVLNAPARLIWFTGITKGEQDPDTFLLADMEERDYLLDEGKSAFLLDIKYLLRKRFHIFYNIFILLVLFSSLLLLLISPRVMEKNLFTPLSALMTGVEKLSSGELGVDLKPTFGDEIGKMSSALNEMVENLKKIEKSHHQPIEQFSAAFEANPIAAMVLDLSFKIAYINTSFSELTGYVKEEVIGDTPAILKSGQTLPEVYTRMWLAISKGEVWRGELLNHDRNGEEFWVYTVIAPIKNDKEKISHYVWMMENFTERKQNEERLLKLSTIDSLTEIYNRRQLFTLGEKAFSQNLRYQQPFSVLLIDIDHFKRVNDMHGHAVGDEVIKQVALLINNNIRHADIFGRYGGEEFLLIMPNTNVEQAQHVAENLRQLIAKHENISSGKKINLTISIGISSRGPQRISCQEVVNQADQALYKAKNAGRNRVEVYTEDTIPKIC